MNPTSPSLIRQILGALPVVGKLLVPGLCLLIAWIVLFELFRGLLIGATWSFRGGASPALLLESCWRGLRFDLAVAAQIVALFALWSIWRDVPTKTEKRAVITLFSVVAFLCIFTLVIEVEFYKEFETRLNSSAFQFVSSEAEHNATIVGMIWHGYPVLRWMFFCFLIWGAFVWTTNRFLTMRKAQARWPLSMLATLLWALLTVVASRGGFQQSVLRWGDAVFSHNTYANHMAENGVFALIDIIRNRAKTSKNIGRWKQSIPLPEAIALVREITVLPNEKLVDPEKYPLLRVSPPSSMVLQKRPRNVVLIMMESFSARFCGAIGAPYEATPNFDALARQGILFDRAFSVGTHTAQGVFGTLCSFPNLPNFEGLMKHPLGRQPFRTLPQVLRDSGFETLFLYNGLFSWDNKEGFFRNHGIQRFIGRKDYVNPTFVDPDWGVSDQDVFDRAISEFGIMAKRGTPFLGLILTLSNHAPFNLPKVPGLEPITAGGEQNKRLSGIQYADWALGQFMKSARQSAWFDDTLFVFVGDHGFGIPPNLTEVSLLHMHVPLLFFGPGIFASGPSVHHRVASQLDILPSIVGLLGASVPHQSFGRDLFSLAPDDPGHACVKRSGSSWVGWIEGNEIAVANPGLPTTFHVLDLSFPPTASLELASERSSQAKAMDRRLHAFVAAGYATLERYLAAPPK